MLMNVELALSAHVAFLVQEPLGSDELVNIGVEDQLVTVEAKDDSNHHRARWENEGFVPFRDDDTKKRKGPTLWNWFSLIFTVLRGNMRNAAGAAGS